MAATAIIRAYDTVAGKDIFWTTDTPFGTHAGYPGPSLDYPNAWADLADVCLLQTLPSAGGVASVTFTAVKDALAAANSSFSVNTQTITDLAAPLQPTSAARLQDATEAAEAAVTAANSYTDAAVAGLGGAPSRIVALDANDVLAWEFDSAPPIINAGSGGTCSLDSHPTWPTLAPKYVAGGSIFGEGYVLPGAYDTDAMCVSPATTIGESAEGTIHGWVKLSPGAVPYTGTLASKDDGSSLVIRPWDRTSQSLLFGLTVKVGDSGEVNMGNSNASYAIQNALPALHASEWGHIAVTWKDGKIRAYINGQWTEVEATYTTIAWAAGRWGFSYPDKVGYGARSWRVCNVARSASYIDEVYRRAVGRWP